MKINCDVSQNFFKCYSEARAVAGQKKKILKTKKVGKINYIMQMILIYLAILLFSTLLLFLHNFWLCIIIVFVITADIIYFSYGTAKVFMLYFFRKKMNFKSSIIIDEDGLTDQSYYGIKMIFAWKKLKAVVIKNNSVTILTDTPCFFYFDIAEKDNILKAILKYKKNILIVDK